jgi:hypothetical protein
MKDRNLRKSNEKDKSLQASAETTRAHMKHQKKIVVLHNQRAQ